MMHTDFIPYGRQSISEEDIAAVVKSLRSDFLTQGPCVSEFEHALCTKVGARYGVAANSATSALHLACLALGVGAGDRVWTSPNTFIASANCARYCGAEVDFVDIDPRTYNMCADKLAEKLQAAKLTGTLPKVVIPVHFAGQSCDMAAIHTLSKAYGFRIIEDASHAIGAKYQGEYVGNGQCSDICVFSFHPVKIITSAEGGMAVTNDEHLAEHMRTHASQGTTKSPDELTQMPGDWYYEQHTLGFNYRMTELQAALGLSQLSRLDDFIEGRHQQFAHYEALLKGFSITLPYQADDSDSALHLYPILLPEHNRAARKGVFDSLRQAGVGTQVHYIPVHLQPYYQALGFKQGDFPMAEDYYARTLSLPLFADLTLAQQERVALILKHALIANRVMSA
ncbi:UDP-4-amino-4,6-dideoxy-N-acetyl-beta-L-altrosamine transaminase [Marinomonas sp. M1K-6]|uniref:UDP-4-amino-4, 6-dideoxy-N-acetyl-beta-L-altrosamine transaminase n=1 Tax=Marinomonas profundi TaxID=2726122 RepID=A0A847R8J0_9GAMM|nr:UDP-4-amino-4,6-dideoxy-N-acetyl-beta-L-altrosamine transaminase [Marinomonas profundi]NLQ18793.1 UDP-4-amino-4,6-dideoxy-N-acetyl-beta-L-altrosamine transaminase [Marinomonas profundi]UDV02273.1 UDP-4-amino-4,6-dideoxy-N-acetyl-beta-L-altrosamine transaminase [Marinomonas profundi]